VNKKSQMEKGLDKYGSKHLLFKFWLGWFSRFDELPSVRPMRDQDPYFSSMKARNAPPDFMPNFQNAAKKAQMNDGRPRRVQAQKSRTTDGQV
jgi:hypothetical protein